MIKVALFTKMVSESNQYCWFAFFFSVFTLPCPNEEHAWHASFLPSFLFVFVVGCAWSLGSLTPGCFVGSLAPLRARSRAFASGADSMQAPVVHVDSDVARSWRVLQGSSDRRDCVRSPTRLLRLGYVLIVDLQGSMFCRWFTPRTRRHARDRPNLTLTLNPNPHGPPTGAVVADKWPRTRLRHVRGPQVKTLVRDQSEGAHGVCSPKDPLSNV